MTAASVQIDPPSRREYRALKRQQSFERFVRDAWGEVEGNELVWNWHLSLKADRLQKVTEREIRRLVIEEPPGFAKSLFVSVLWPAWEWLRRPEERSQYLSGSDSVRIRDSRRCRNLLKSQWYQRQKQLLWLDWTFSPDQDEKTHFANTDGGERMTGVIGGKITGDRADKQVLDDPYDIKEATRGTEKRVRERMEEVVRDWDDVLADRLNDERTDPRVLIMQRVHEADLAGRLEERASYEVVKVRMEYDPTKAIHEAFDPRNEKGELAFPERFPERVVAERRKSSAYPSTNNQDPQPDKGGIYKAGWFYTTPESDTLDDKNLYRELPPLRLFDVITQSWDFSKGSQEPDASYSVGHIIGRMGPQIWLFPVEMREQCRFRRMKEMVRAVSSQWPDVGRKLVENKGSGPEVVEELKGDVGGFIDFEPQGRGSKDVRGDIASEPIEAGDFMLPHPVIAPWIRDWVRELLRFPAEPNDRVDTWSQFVIWSKSHGGASTGGVVESTNQQDTFGTSTTSKTDVGKYFG